MLGLTSHTRNKSYPLPSGSKTIGPRKPIIHNLGLSVNKSPDGANVGIISHLSVLAR